MINKLQVKLARRVAGLLGCLLRAVLHVAMFAGGRYFSEARVAGVTAPPARVGI
jgi:hypothetical protein